MTFKILLISSFFVFILYSVNTEGRCRQMNKIDEDANGQVNKQIHDVRISIDKEGKLIIEEDVYEEIQYFNDNATLYSEQTIGYSGSFSELRDVEAYSLVPDGKNRLKKIKVEKFITSDARSRDIFYDDRKKVSFVFPALRAGAKTVMKYTKSYKEPRLWGYYIFSSYLPVVKSIFTVTAPVEVILNYDLFNIDKDRVHFTREQKGKNIIYRWEASGLDRIRSAGSGGILHVAPHLIIYIQSYEYDGITRHVLGDINNLYAWYTGFLEGLNDEGDEGLKNMVSEIIEGKQNEREKVKAIYYWVQQNIKYIAIEDGLGGFRPRSAKTVFTRRYGDCKDMSNLLHRMLDIAQIPSSLAWIGTTSIPYTHTEVPTPMADNHMICTYETGNKYYFLDATGRYNVLGMPTEHIQGREALVYRSVSDFELIEVPVVEPAVNATTDSVFVTIDESGISGKGKEIFKGYARVPVAYNLENLEEDDKKAYLNELLKKGNNKFRLQRVKTQNVSGIREDLQIEYDFTVKDYTLSTDKEIFINPHLTKIEPAGLIDPASVKQDIFYSHKFLTVGVTRIEVPKGYTVSYLPLNNEYHGDEFGYSLRYYTDNGFVVVNHSFLLNTLKVRKEKFDEWNKMIKSLYRAYKETIVLEKNR